MTWALGHLGWTKAYLLAASLGLVLAVVTLLVLHDSPTHRNLRGPSLSFAAVRRSLASSWAIPAPGSASGCTSRPSSARPR